MWTRCNVLEVALCPTILWLSCVGVETWKLLPLVWQPRKPEKIGFRGLKSTSQNLQTHMPICIHENKLIYLCNCESRLHIHSESRFSKFHLDFMLQGMLQWQHLFSSRPLMSRFWIMMVTDLKWIFAVKGEGGTCNTAYQQKQYPIWVFPKIVVPQNGWFVMEHPMKMDDLGVPLFLETYIYIYTYRSGQIIATSHDLNPKGDFREIQVGENYSNLAGYIYEGDVSCFNSTWTCCICLLVVLMRFVLLSLVLNVGSSDEAG